MSVNDDKSKQSLPIRTLTCSYRVLTHSMLTAWSPNVFRKGLSNEVRICELRISSSNLYSFFSPLIFESKHH